jgi:hypothetical protein
MAILNEWAALEAAGVRVTEEPRRISFVLPRRSLGPERKAAWILAAFGGFITVFMLFWMGGPISQGLRQPGGFGIAMILFGLLGLPGLAVGAGLMLLGAAIAMNLGHSEIVLTPDRLRSFEVFGPVRLRFSRRLGELRSLGLSPLRGESGRPAPPAIAGAMLLRAEGPGGRFLVLAPGYPAMLLRPLADALSGRVARLSSQAGAPVAVPVVVEDASAAEPPAPKPAGTPIALQEVQDGFAFVVPPAGLWKGSKGLFFFGLVWNLFILGFAVAVLTGSSLPGAVAPLLFLSLFAAVGVAIMLWAIHLGRTRTLVAAAKGRLAVRRIGPFHRREETWPVADIAAVRIGPSGMEVNDRPVLELQVHLRGGRTFGLLAERADDEIRWMASEIRRRLAVPAEPAA